MEGDMLDRLRAKEEEMEALINDARKRAAAIKEDALKKARELKERKVREIEAELQSRRTLEEEENIRNGMRRIEEAEEAIEELRKRAELKRGEAVKEVMRLTLVSATRGIP